MPAKAYAKMIARTQDKCYFIWDALKDALILELSSGNQDLIVKLCKIPIGNPAKREMLIEVLTEYGRAGDTWNDKAIKLINRLL